MQRNVRSAVGLKKLALAWALLLPAICLASCGGKATYSPPPIQLSVSLANTTVAIAQGKVVLVPVTIVAPTETATFSITGLPNGVSEVYKESESNPSGQLTLTAADNAQIGSFTPKITVGSSGQTASLVFTIVVSE
jgi:hypothetical protein